MKNTKIFLIFVERFAPTKEDYDRVIAYAESVGLTVRNTHPNRTLLNVEGSANGIESAFNLSLYEYQLPSGRKFHAPNNEPEVPASIASTILGIIGLDTEAKWHPNYRLNEDSEDSLVDSSTSPHRFPSGPRGGYAPGDIAKAYNLTGVHANGSGQAIALLELARYNSSDINVYTNHFGLPAAKLTNVIVDGGSRSGNNAEVVLDIELALALAPQSHRHNPLLSVSGEQD